MKMNLLSLSLKLINKRTHVVNKAKAHPCDLMSRITPSLHCKSYYNSNCSVIVLLCICRAKCQCQSKCLVLAHTRPVFA